MTDRYQRRPSLAGDYDHGGDPREPEREDNDPLAELARLIGQADPFGNGRTSAKAQPRSVPEPYRHPEEAYEEPYQEPYEEPPPAGQPPSPPSWMQRANVQPPVSGQPQAYSDPHSGHPYGTQPYDAPEQDYYQQDHYQHDYDRQAAYPEPEGQPDPSRYDDALYGQLETGVQDYQREAQYPNDPYADQDDYAEENFEEDSPKRRGGMIMVAAVLALAVLGISAAYAYRTYIGSPRSGEPPIIKADNSPTKIVPAPSDATSKLPDRMVSNDSAEKIVPREEAPIDVNAQSAPRMVSPPPSQNANPTEEIVVPNGGATPNNEPRKVVRTLTVKGDQTEGITPPPPAATKSAAAPKAAARNPSAQANANANAPLSLAPGAPPQAENPTRVAATNPAQAAPVSSGSYLVQVASVPTNEADAKARYRVLQGKYPSFLGSHSVIVKRFDAGAKGIFYRAMVGPFASQEEASRLCGGLKSAGQDCLIQRN